MLPRMAQGHRKPIVREVTISKIQVGPPPDVGLDQNGKGGFALRKLKQYCDDIYAINTEYAEKYNHSQVVIAELAKQNANMLSLLLLT